MKVIRAVHYRR